MPINRLHDIYFIPVTGRKADIPALLNMRDTPKTDISAFPCIIYPHKACISAESIALALLWFLYGDLGVNGLINIAESLELHVEWESCVWEVQICGQFWYPTYRSRDMVHAHCRFTFKMATLQQISFC